MRNQDRILFFSMNMGIANRKFMNRIIMILTIGIFFHFNSWSQNVIIIVLDGARYAETCVAENLYMPHLWKEMRQLGTLWTNFRNDSLTSTEPAHSSIVTGKWQLNDNKGIMKSAEPTIFEYFRKATGEPITSTVIVAGKPKLEILAYSTHPDFGIKYKASTFIEKDDISVVKKFKTVLLQNHPRLSFVNLPSTDGAGHSGNWTKYISAIHTADSLIYDIWQTIQADSLYRSNTTLFITIDHGRHDGSRGGFRNHGDGCEGCRHIMLFVIGRGFPLNRTIYEKHTHCDIAPTIGELLSFPTFYSTGISLLYDTAAIHH
jgi:hypothetical protein